MRGVLRNSMQILRCAPGLTIAGITAAVLFSAAVPAGAFLLQKAIEAVIAGLSGSAQGGLSDIILWSAIFLTVRFIASIDDDILYALNAKLIQRVRRSMAPVYNSKLKNLQTRLLEDSKIQDLLSRIGDSPEEAFAQTHSELLALVGVLISLFGMAALFAQAGWWIPLGAVALAVPVFFVNKKSLSEVHQNAADTRLEERKAEYITNLFSARESAKEVRLFDLAEVLSGKWLVIRQKLLSLRSAMLKRQDRRSYLLGLMEMAFKLFCIGMFTRQLLYEEITLAQYVVLIGALQTIYNYFTSHIPGLLMALGYRAAYIGLVEQALDLPEQGAKDKPVPIRSIEFIHVGFAYPGQEPVLKDVSFRIDRDERVALVGVNGAGKSTILKLLLGIYIPCDGKILVNGEDFTYSMDTLSDSFAAVFQDFIPYALTLRENITFGAPQGDEQRLRDALKIVGLDAVGVDIDSRLGKEFFGGEELSHGQWQRLSIARALHKQRDVLILDEPTSALDPIAERDLYFATAGAARAGTSLIVSHRLGYARFAQRILVLEDGIVREEGSHEALMAIEDGLYREMFEKQAAWYREE